MIIKSFPKIFALGTNYVSEITDGEVEITEKVDGSQFVFGKIDGNLMTRSKGTMIFPGENNNMFNLAVDYVNSIYDRIPDNTIFYCEYLQKPHHNSLTYERVPKNNLILFGVCDNSEKFVSEYEELVKYSELLKIEVVPVLYKGKIELKNIEFFDELLKRKSVLGLSEIEGFVVKNYNQPFLLGGQPIPIMSGKYVSENFKEVHRNTWKVENESKSRWGLFIEGYRTEARWEKSVQHLKEKNELKFEPSDIGMLINEVKLDIEVEEKEIIKEFLWKEFGGELLRKSVAGLPEWYKKYLITRS
jgi:hypothetical protein